MDKISFEEAFQKLEEIAQKLEIGDLSLEDSLKLYEEGIRYSRICLKLLNEAKRKIEVVNISDNGEITISEVDAEELLKNE